MTVTSPRSVQVDHARAALVAVLALAQVAVAVTVGPSAFDRTADAYRTPVEPAAWAALAWLPIGLAFLGYACYQCLPRQRTREVHRRTGWWLAVAAAGNVGWVLCWSAGLLPLAELLLITALVALAVVFGRLSREPATTVPERMALRTPVALATGWVSVVIVSVTAATGAWVGLPGHNAIAVVAAVIVLVAVSAVFAWVILNGSAVVGYTVAVIWGLVAVADGGASSTIVVVCVLVVLVVLVAAARRLASAANRARAAFG